LQGYWIYKYKIRKLSDKILGTLRRLEKLLCPYALNPKEIDTSYT
jgi:hypothetical protein